LIDAQGSPGNSYILYKMLANAPGRPDDLADGEVERLMSSLVVGLPMPARPEFTPLSEKQLVDISDWIAAGATCD
jgi:hypothetical protein